MSWFVISMRHSKISYSLLLYRHNLNKQDDYACVISLAFSIQAECVENRQQMLVG